MNRTPQMARILDEGERIMSITPVRKGAVYRQAVPGMRGRVRRFGTQLLTVSN